MNTSMPSDLNQLVRINYGTWRGLVRHALGLVDLQVGRLREFQAVDSLRARRLVFVCLGNINRSAYADVLARRLGEDCASFGLSTTTGAMATAQATERARHNNLDLRAHRATDLRDHDQQSGDLHLVMEVRHARKLVELGIPADQVAFLGLWARPARVHLHDPHTLGDAYYATCMGLIDSAVRELVRQRRGVSA